LARSAPVNGRHVHRKVTKAEGGAAALGVETQSLGLFGLLVPPYVLGAVGDLYVAIVEEDVIRRVDVAVDDVEDLGTVVASVGLGGLVAKSREADAVLAVAVDGGLADLVVGVGRFLQINFYGLAAAFRLQLSDRSHGGEVTSM